MADGRPYLLGLRLAGRRVLVAGGGAGGGRRGPALLRAGAAVFLVSPEVPGSLEDRAQLGRIEWAHRPFQPGDTAGTWLVFACTDDPAANAAIVAEADQHRIWSIRADDAQQSHVWTPASGLAGDVQVGVLSGDPRHSAGIRDAIVTGLRTRTVGARRGRQHRSGVALVGGGPGDPGLITVRGLQLLAEADVVVTDRLAPRSVLDELPPDVEIVDVAKIPYGRSVAQEHINAALVEHAQAGKFVVRLKGGDPYVLGRGGEEGIACLQAGVPVTVVPGITSAVAVPAAAHVPVTHRGVAQEFSVVSVHVPPGDPRSTVDWPALAALQGTLVLLMAVERLAAVAETLIRHGRSAQTPVSVIADGTLPTQRTIVATLDTVASRVLEDGVRPPAVVVIGEVVNVAAEIAELMRALPRRVPGEPGADPARTSPGTAPA